MRCKDYIMHDNVGGGDGGHTDSSDGCNDDGSDDMR